MEIAAKTSSFGAIYLPAFNADPRVLKRKERKTGMCGRYGELNGTDVSR